jgi:hypothetical protein
MAKTVQSEKVTVIPDVKKTCGIVMPISGIDGCSEHHWQDVSDILSDAIETSGFEPNLVSNADEVGFINKRIIQNLYENPIVVCDVSGKNPNVMFELGMRLAFDKPTIIVKDDKTTYTFDIGGIEHLQYPRDLRFAHIVEFKEKLAEKIVATVKAAEADTGYTTFLKHFGEFTVTKLDSKEVSGQEFILDELKSMRHMIASIGRSEVNSSRTPLLGHGYAGEFCVKGKSEVEARAIAEEIKSHPRVLSAHVKPVGSHFHVHFRTKSREMVEDLRRLFGDMYGPKKKDRVPKDDS